MVLSMRACAAALAIGAGASAAVGATDFRLFGDASPADRSLTHVHVVAYFPEDGGIQEALGGWLVGDAPIGIVTPIDIDSGAGIDVSGGLYAILGVHEDDGVSISLSDSAFSEGVTEWADLFATAEATIQEWLETSNKAELYNWFNNEVRIPGHATPFGTRATIVDFTAAETNGDGVVNFEIIPAPGVVAVLGLGVCGVIQRRR